MGPRPTLGQSGKSLWLLSAGEMKGTQLRLRVLQPRLSKKTGSGFKPSIKSISPKKESRSCHGDSAQPREPSVMHGPLTRSSLQPRVPQRASKQYCSAPFCVSAEWWVALEEGKVAQGHCADPLLHPPPPPLRSSSLPSHRACAPERCRRAVSERPRCPAPRRAAAAAGAGKQIGLM